MSLPLSDEVKDKLSELETQTIEDILLIVNDAQSTGDPGDDCRQRCEIAAEIGNAGCDAMDSPIARAACRLAVKVTKDACIRNC